MRIATIYLLLVLPFLSKVADADERAWPVGQIYLTYDETDQLLCGAGPPPFDFYVMARIDYAAIGQPDLNASNAMLGWEVRLESPYDDVDVVEIELFPATATDASPDPFTFQVDLGQPVSVSSTPLKLARLRLGAPLPSTPWIEILGVQPSSFPPYLDGRPGWTDDKGSAECMGPCLRPFQGTYEAGTLTESGPFFCWPDACWSVIERPLAGDIFEGGSEQTLLFSTTASNIYAPIEVTLDGEIWTRLAFYDDAGAGSLVWKVPNVDTVLAQLRMCDGCCFLGPYHTYSGVFTIAKQVETQSSTWSAVKAMFD